MNRPEFSVLLPTRNRVRLLAEAIETVRAQGNPPPVVKGLCK